MSKGGSPTIRLTDIGGGVMELVLASPATGNALTLDACQTLNALAEELSSDRAARAVLLRAEGRAFCVGGSLDAFASADDPERLLNDMAAALHCAMTKLKRLDAPLVTAVQGAAAGAGLGLATMGDIVLAGASSSFTWAYTAVGLSGDAGTTWLLPRLIGLRRTQAMALTNERLDAATAAAMGLVTEVVPDADLLARSTALACGLAAGPTAAFGAVKRLLDQSDRCAFETQLDAERREIAALAGGFDGKEGVRAFLERRPACFGPKPSGC